MGRTKRPRIQVVEEDDEPRAAPAVAPPTGGAQRQQQSPAAVKASKAKAKAVAAASSERLREAAQAGKRDDLSAALSSLEHGDAALDLVDWGGESAA
jgi:hypothetical protein